MFVTFLGGFFGFPILSGKFPLCFEEVCSLGGSVSLKLKGGQGPQGLLEDWVSPAEETPSQLGTFLSSWQTGCLERRN